MSGQLMTLGKVAIEMRCSEYHLRTLAARGKVPFTSAGRYRLFDKADFPTIRRALVEAGYIPQPQQETN